MPGYAISYLVIFWLMTLGGIAGDVRDGKPHWHSALHALSGAFVSLFVYAWFHRDLAESIGWGIAPMIVAGFLWEVYAYSEDMREFDANEEMTEEERKMVGRSVTFVVVPFILLGYVTGLKLLMEIAF